MFDTIAEKDFLKNAKTGDLLLFRCAHQMAGILRKTTNSFFDHVAMIIRYPGIDFDAIFYMECVGNSGV